MAKAAITGGSNSNPAQARLDDALMMEVDAVAGRHDHREAGQHDQRRRTRTPRSGW